ncbi:MAG: hypothetical protein HMLKMBBP_01250 [Planctomycetes bacterium]|nr:hypothetical protein [Planctomycetota bacterium]
MRKTAICLLFGVAAFTLTGLSLAQERVPDFSGLRHLRGGDNRLCLDYDTTCTIIMKANTLCSGAGAISCQSTGCSAGPGNETCIATNVVCSEDATVVAKYCYATSEEPCTPDGEMICGTIPTGTCQYTGVPQPPPACGPGDPRVLCQTSGCTATDSIPCRITLCR